MANYNIVLQWFKRDISKIRQYNCIIIDIWLIINLYKYKFNNKRRIIMDNVLCPKCGEIIFEEPGCEANGIITCDKCKERIIWKCDEKKTVVKIFK